MRHFFSPESIVVIGVSTRPTNLGKEIVKNLFEFRFNGVVHFVGPHEGVLFGQRIHKSLESIDEAIDLAIILTPAKTVPSILEECGIKGIRRIVIESGGFGELDSSGRSLGQSLFEIAQKYDMRFIGPNCIGIMNSRNGLATPFTAMYNVFKKGGIGIIAQSGGVALSLLNMFDGEQLGFSKFAAIGNKLNVDENDLLEYYLDDPDTNIVCMYLESIRDGRRLMDLGIKSSKPIVVHKANTGGLSTKVAQSHTDAMTNNDQVVDAAMKQAGIARFRGMQSYLDFVKILQLPKIQGRRLAIISRSGGHAVIAADAANAYDFNLPPFSEAFLSEIRNHVRADVIRLANPLDLGDLFDFNAYVQIIEHTLQQPNIDVILFSHTYFAAVEGETSRSLLEKTAELSYKYNKAVAMCVSTEQYELSLLHKEFDFPIFMSPERAIVAIDASLKYGERNERKHRSAYEAAPLENKDQLDITFEKVIKSGRPPLLHEMLEIMELIGIPIPTFRVVRKLEQIEEITTSFEKAVALKVISSTVSHKSDVGGVLLNVQLPDIKESIIKLYNQFSGHDGFYGILIQEMIERPPGIFELILGAKRDPQFGPVVMLGIGGIFTELLNKSSIRVVPMSNDEIESMIEDLPGHSMLDGARGQKPIDKKALIRVIQAISALMLQFDAIDSLDINPLMVFPEGVLAIDGRIFLNKA